MEKLKGKCKDCYGGCGRMELEDFKGVKRCEHYTEPPKGNTEEKQGF